MGDNNIDAVSGSEAFNQLDIFVQDSSSWIGRVVKDLSKNQIAVGISAVVIGALLGMTYFYSKSLEAKFTDEDKMAAYELASKGCWVKPPNSFFYSEAFAIQSAFFAAAQDDDSIDVSRCIQYYGIKDEKVRIEIAKIIAVKKPLKISRNIRNFDIKDEKGRIEIAKIIAVKKGFNPLDARIQNFDIKDEEGRIEIVKILVTTHKRSHISAFIQEFNIKDEKTRIEIAKIEAANNGNNLSNHIKNYKIESEKGLIEIAKIAVAQYNGEWVFRNLNNYGIKKIQDILSIFSIANLQASCQDEPPFKLVENLYDAFAGLNSDVMNLQSFYELLALFAAEKGWIFPEKILDKIKKTENPMIQKNLSIWVACFLSHCKNKKISKKQFKYLTEHALLDSIISYPDPKMRNQLMDSFVSLATNETKRGYVGELLKLKKPPHTKLPMLLLANLRAEGVNEEVCNAQFKIVSHVTFKQGKNLKVYMNALYAISNSNLKLEDKEYLLKSISFENILSTLRTIQTFHDLGKMSELNKENFEKLSISQILENNVKELIPMKERADFDEKLEKYFGENRVPNFIFTYAAKLKEDIELKDCLGYIVDAVLDENFKDMRYDLSKSEHLTKVFSKRQDLLEKWKTGASGKLGDFLVATSTSVKPVDFHALLKENILRQGHLKSDDAPFLFEFLNGKMTLESIEKQLTKDPDNKILIIQRNTAKLTDEKLSFEEKKELLKAIDNDLKEVVLSKPHFAEFQNDIKGFLSGLIKQNTTQENYNKFTITDTDNYEDLFLSGTEVDGSCQRIDGDLEKNKCLMGYVLDGKNRLLAVKDENGRIMARHIFRILLDGDKPVLFMETVYPKVVDQNLRQGLEAFAKQRAEELGLPLLIDDSSKPEYGRSIQSLSTLSPVPFEYADAGNIHVTSGMYAIANPSVV